MASKALIGDILVVWLLDRLTRSLLSNGCSEMIKKLYAAWIAAMCVTCTTAYAWDDKTVTVSATATGGFGSPPRGFVPLVKAVTIENAGTITIEYNSGTWCINQAICGIGPNGINFDNATFATPLQKSIGVRGGLVTNIGALIGAFVPKVLVNTPGFRALDGTRIKSGVGIMPNHLFFVGSFNVIDGGGPGTLYLGMNDGGVTDNSGALTVTVTADNHD